MNIGPSMIKYNFYDILKATLHSDCCLHGDINRVSPKFMMGT